VFRVDLRKPPPTTISFFPLPCCCYIFDYGITNRNLQELSNETIPSTPRLRCSTIWFFSPPPPSQNFLEETSVVPLSASRRPKTTLPFLTTLWLDRRFFFPLVYPSCLRTHTRKFQFSSKLGGHLTSQELVLPGSLWIAAPFTDEPSSPYLMPINLLPTFEETVPNKIPVGSPSPCPRLLGNPPPSNVP